MWLPYLYSDRCICMGVIIMRCLHRDVLLKTVLFTMALLAGGVPGVSLAGAQGCSYGEARMALENGNAVRGLALMRMANRDGDPRAEAFLRKQDYALAQPVLKLPLTLTSASASSK